MTDHLDRWRNSPDTPPGIGESPTEAERIERVVRGVKLTEGQARFLQLYATRRKSSISMAYAAPRVWGPLVDQGVVVRDGNMLVLTDQGEELMAKAEALLAHNDGVPKPRGRPKKTVRTDEARAPLKKEHDLYEISHGLTGLDFRKYLDELNATGLYGRTRTAVIRRLVEQGIMRAMADGLIRKPEVK